MANKIQVRRGLKASLPTLSAGEPAYTTDTRELFVGTGSGNVNMGGGQWNMGTAISGTSSTTGAYSYSGANAKVGDCYLNTSNGNVYACTTAGTGTTAKWTYKGCIRGATGSNGTDGESGSHWYRGTAMSGTSTTTGIYSYSSCPIVKLDDIYLNTSNGNIYACTTAGSGTAAKWTYQGCIKGDNATVTVDHYISSESTRPVQNKVLYQEFKRTLELCHYIAMGAAGVKNDMLIDSSDSVDNKAYIPTGTVGNTDTVITKYCYNAKNAPNGIVFGMLRCDDFVEFHGSSKYYYQTFTDLFTGDDFYRNLYLTEGDDGKYYLLDDPSVIDWVET